jgi:undecaprenyl diphosphate synthase
VNAAKRLAMQVERGELRAQDVDMHQFARGLCLADLPAPDLFIRTGGDMRVSNFLLWDIAYAELYFTETLWPAFDRDALGAALIAFANRERRFGRTGEQVRAERDRMPGRGDPAGQTQQDPVSQGGPLTLDAHDSARQRTNRAR